MFAGRLFEIGPAYRRPRGTLSTIVTSILKSRLKAARNCLSFSCAFEAEMAAAGTKSAPGAARWVIGIKGPM